MSGALTQLDHFRLLGPTGLRVSPLCLGTMTFGEAYDWAANKDISRRMFDLYRERGGNFIDTADFYTKGQSEQYVGEFLKGERDRWVLSTKYSLLTNPTNPNMGGNHRACLVRALEASLQRLQTDYIDVYWLHCLDSTTPIEEYMRTLDDVVRAGKVLYIGMSNAYAWTTARANAIADFRGWSPFVALQIPYSVAWRDVEREILPMALQLGLGVLPWSPLAGGLLSGKYTAKDMAADAPPPEAGTRRANVRKGLDAYKLRVAETVQNVAKEVGRSPSQVALNWLLQKPAVTSPILGARTVEQLQDNLACLDFVLPPEHIRTLDEASAIDLGYPNTFINGPIADFCIYNELKVHKRWPYPPR